MSGPAVRRTRCPQHARQAWESQAAATAGGPAWHLASACGNVAPARNTGLGCAEAFGDVACMGHAGTWSSGDARGWKSSRGGQAVASPAPPEAETSAATWPPDLCSSLLVTRPRVKPAGVGSTSRGRRRRAARGSHAGVLPGRLGVRGDLSVHSRQARSPWTRCGGRAGGGSGRLVPHPRLAQLPGVWAAAHCSRCPRRHRSRGSPSASHVPDRCA